MPGDQLVRTDAGRPTHVKKNSLVLFLRIALRRFSLCSRRMSRRLRLTRVFRPLVTLSYRRPAVIALSSRRFYPALLRPSIPRRPEPLSRVPWLPALRARLRLAISTPQRVLERRSEMGVRSSVPTFGWTDRRLWLSGCLVGWLSLSES